jgi:alkanesulfonate monooxygenase SsuD/methylene tetrahydromethanopterin reductase-like flavin-dependent oxidoreductase (luciferase family)
MPTKQSVLNLGVFRGSNDVNEREMIRKSMMIGTPREVAAQLQAYADAGVTRVMVTDLPAGLLQIDDALRRTIEVCQRLKSAVPAPVVAS